MLHRVQQDYDSAHDKFHTQNIAIKDIRSHGNVDVSLQNLRWRHPMLHHVQQDHDSAHDTFDTQNIRIKNIDSHGNVAVSLQELNWFTNAVHSVDNDFKTAGSDISNEAKKIMGTTVTTFANVDQKMQTDMQNFQKGASNAEKVFLVKANEAAKRVGPAFKIAEKDMEWAAGETWKGIKWCYNDAPCKAAVEKYGMMAVQAAVTAAMAQQ